MIEGAASVVGNAAGTFGGGVWSDKRVTLAGSAAVTGTTAGTAGGIYDVRSRVYACSLHVELSPNDPDDPPPVRPCAT